MSNSSPSKFKGILGAIEGLVNPSPLLAFVMLLMTSKKSVKCPIRENYILKKEDELKLYDKWINISLFIIDTGIP